MMLMMFNLLLHSVMHNGGGGDVHAPPLSDRHESGKLGA
jgi:hypothetical protein